MGRGSAEKPPSGSLYPRESYVCFFIFLVELASVNTITNVNPQKEPKMNIHFVCRAGNFIFFEIITNYISNNIFSKL